MTYSCSDFADDVINRLVDIGALDATNIPENDPQAQASLAVAAITALQRGPRASRFANELLDLVESLSAVSEHHGPQALVDLFYLLAAILDGTHIWLDAQASVSALIRALPSALEWRQCIEVDGGLDVAA